MGGFFTSYDHVVGPNDHAEAWEINEVNWEQDLSTNKDILPGSRKDYGTTVDVARKSRPTLELMRQQSHG